MFYRLFTQDTEFTLPEGDYIFDAIDESGRLYKQRITPRLQNCYNANDGKWHDVKLDIADRRDFGSFRVMHSDTNYRVIIPQAPKPLYAVIRSSAPITNETLFRCYVLLEHKINSIEDRLSTLEKEHSELNCEFGELKKEMST